MDRGDHYPAFPFCIASALSARSFDGNRIAAGKVENTEETLAQAREEIPRGLVPPTYLRSVCAGDIVEAFAHVVEAGSHRAAGGLDHAGPPSCGSSAMSLPSFCWPACAGHLPRDTRHQHAAL
jgi:hypothetical protein